MDVVERFCRLRDSRLQDLSDVGLPTALVEACHEVLGVDGVGLSLTDEVRIPLAASTQAAIRAEQIQTTLGDGPCLMAAELGHPVVADAAMMAEQWPMFAEQLTATTPFHSVGSVPLQAGQLFPFGAMDLYSVSDNAKAIGTVIDEAEQIAGLVTDALLDGAGSATGLFGADGWASEYFTNGRARVWNAVGILMAHAGMPSRDALSALRGYAFSHDLTLDELSDQLVTRQLPAAAVA